MAKSAPEYPMQYFSQGVERSNLCTAFENGTICLLWMSTDRLRSDHVDAWRDHLPESEWQRALKYRREKDKVSYIASRIILRHSVASLLDIVPVNVSLERDPNGKPQVRNPSAIGPVHVNLSHADGLCIVALSRMGAIGVDVESLDRSLSADFCHLICSEDETREITDFSEKARNPALIVLWTLKEALVKASGQGLHALMETICCSSAEGGLPSDGRTDRRRQPDRRADATQQ